MKPIVPKKMRHLNLQSTTGANMRYFEASVQAVPEPATALLLAIGGGLTWLLRMKQWS